MTYQPKHAAVEHRARRWPTVVTAAVGVALTTVAIVWMGATYDAHGDPLLDDAVARVLVSLIGAAATVGAVLAQRALGQIKHEVKNSHGTNLRSDLDLHAKRTERLLHEVHKMQQALARLDSIPSEMSGLRRDVGRQATTDQQTHEDVAQLRREHTELRTDVSAHLAWSRDFETAARARQDAQEARLTNLEKGTSHDNP